MLNLVDNKIPRVRDEPMLLAVFVYHTEPEQLKHLKDGLAIQQDATGVGSPTPAAPAQRSNSTASAGPAFSPATPQAPQGGFPQQSSPAQWQSTTQTPVPIPQPPNYAKPQPPPPPPVAPPKVTDAQKHQAQQAGMLAAQEMLGPLINVPTVQFILPQAYQMARKEWEVVRRVLERDPKARDDLQHLGILLERETGEKNGGAVAP